MSAAGGPHSAERWSGLETEEMRATGSTLLFPSDSKVRFELNEFDGCVVNEGRNHVATTYLYARCQMLVHIM
jgi:hypothetical protein